MSFEDKCGTVKDFVLNIFKISYTWCFVSLSFQLGFAEKL